jgi:hypothetical protein
MAAAADSESLLYVSSRHRYTRSSIYALNAQLDCMTSALRQRALTSTPQRAAARGSAAESFARTPIKIKIKNSIEINEECRAACRQTAPLTVTYVTIHPSTSLTATTTTGDTNNFDSA